MPTRLNLEPTTPRRGAWCERVAARRASPVRGRAGGSRFPAPRDRPGRGGRKKVMRSWCCSPKQALIWSAGAVFSPLFSSVFAPLQKVLQGRSRRGHPSKSTYLHICSDVGIFSPALLAGGAVVIQAQLRVDIWAFAAARPGPSPDLPLSSYLREKKIIKRTKK